MNDATLTSWAKTLGVRVEERRLAGDRCGIYYAPLRLIILDERLAGFQRRCTLCHELIVFGLRRPRPLGRGGSKPSSFHRLI